MSKFKVNSTDRWRTAAQAARLASCCCLFLATGAWAQVPEQGLPTAHSPLPKHYLHSADLPPGEVGRRQLLRGHSGECYQPVEVTGPEGSLISFQDGTTFQPATGNVVRSGMLIGQVYRLRVGNIPFREGFEVYPSVELIERLHPPPGQEFHFPIPIELTTEELQMAADGKYVTRVIYLEEPQTALGVQDAPGKQRYFEVAPGQDPLEIADRVGRPMAILRMGSRVPDAAFAENDGFQLPQGPLQPYEKPPVVSRTAGLEPRFDPRQRTFTDATPAPKTSTRPASWSNWLFNSLKR